MRPPHAAWIVLAASFALAAPGPARSQGFADEEHDWGVEPVHQLRQRPYTAPTPREIPGGQVVKTRELQEMLGRSPAPIAIDVISGEEHLSLAGAVWLGGAGTGMSFIDPLQAELQERLQALTGADKTRELVFFCVNAQCWLSYNAALRALALGYTRVYWYRGGIAAWRDAGLALGRTRREAGPAAQ